MDKEKIGPLVFIVGLILAIIVAIFAAGSPAAWAVWVLAILGLIAGLMNITDKEILHFLVASIAFLLTFQILGDVISSLAFGWQAVETFFYLLSVFVAPATAVVAVKTLFATVKN